MFVCCRSFVCCVCSLVAAQFLLLHVFVFVVCLLFVGLLTWDWTCWFLCLLGIGIVRLFIAWSRFHLVLVGLLECWLCCPSGVCVCVFVVCVCAGVV